MCAYSPLVHAPFYVAATYAFIKEKNWIRVPALVWSGIMLGALTPVFIVNLTPSHPSASPKYVPSHPRSRTLIADGRGVGVEVVPGLRTTPLRSLPHRLRSQPSLLPRRLQLLPHRAAPHDRPHVVGPLPCEGTRGCEEERVGRALVSRAVHEVQHAPARALPGHARRSALHRLSSGGCGSAIDSLTSLSQRKREKARETITRHTRVLCVAGQEHEVTHPHTHATKTPHGSCQDIQRRNKIEAQRLDPCGALPRSHRRGFHSSSEHIEDDAKDVFRSLVVDPVARAH